MAHMKVMLQRPPATGDPREVTRWALGEARRVVLAVLSASGHGPGRVWLHGSRARGDARAFSDIDIAIEHPGGELPPSVLAELRALLEESCIPFEVDIVDLSVAGGTLRESVRNEGIPWTP